MCLTRKEIKRNQCETHKNSCICSVAIFLIETESRIHKQILRKNMASDDPSPHFPSLRLGLPAPQPSRRHHAQSLLAPSSHEPRTHHVLNVHIYIYIYIFVHIPQPQMMGYLALRWVILLYRDRWSLTVSTSSISSVVSPPCRWSSISRLRIVRNYVVPFDTFVPHDWFPSPTALQLLKLGFSGKPHLHRPNYV